uniref:Uncharacterized protein n=1 Tax=Rhizophora mucronata TaxID=61149 RepID=A0A2P2NFQ5_RHIMU
MYSVHYSRDLQKCIAVGHYTCISRTETYSPVAASPPKSKKQMVMVMV